MRKAIVTFVMLFTWTAWAEAQQRGEQNPPPPPPQPAPQPRIPTPVPDRPQPGAESRVTISGRLIATSRLPERTIEIRLEGQSSERAGFAYTDGAGEFTFRDISINPDQFYYIVANVDGFKPVRERLDYGRDLSFAPRVTIFLEPEVALSKADGKGGSVVGVKQLTARIPDKAVDEYKKALKDSTAGNYGKAVERLERAIQLAPDFYEAQNNLGAQYLRAQRHADAEKAFEHARDLNPEAAEPMLNLGTLHYQQGEIQSDARKEEAAAAFGKAVEFLEEAIRRNPALASAHHYLGAALYKTGSYERAESTLRRALDLDSKLVEAELMLVNVYTRQNRFDEAVRQINSYLERNPKAPQRASLEKIKQQIEKLLKP